jgi:hypothetical protein
LPKPGKIPPGWYVFLAAVGIYMCKAGGCGLCLYKKAVQHEKYEQAEFHKVKIGGSRIRCRGFRAVGKGFGEYSFLPRFFLNDI